MPNSKEALEVCQGYQSPLKFKFPLLRLMIVLVVFKSWTTLLIKLINKLISILFLQKGEWNIFYS